MEIDLLIFRFHFVCVSLCPQPLSKSKLLKLKSLLQAKAVIQAVYLRAQAVSIKLKVLGLKGGLWVC